jgi:nucleotide-binding universal stress UspA family protein
MSATSPEILFPKILVCSDGSPDSEGAVNAALQLAQTSGSQIFLLEVTFLIAGYDLQAPDTLTPPALNLDLMQAQEKAVQERLAMQQSQAAKQGVNLETRIRTSASAYEGIMEEVQELEPDLIVMGRHGYTGLTRLLMGSTTARVIGHSPVNVLVIPAGASLSFECLLVASDGSPYSEAAWTEALILARAMHSAMVAVSVAADEPEKPSATQVARAMAQAAEQQGLPVDTLIPLGRPDEGIINAAIFKQASLIIVGTHGRTGLMRLLMGSVAERVIGHATCPVLMVKKK